MQTTMLFRKEKRLAIGEAIGTCVSQTRTRFESNTFAGKKKKMPVIIELRVHCRTKTGKMIESLQGEALGMLAPHAVLEAA